MATTKIVAVTLDQRDIIINEITLKIKFASKKLDANLILGWNLKLLINNKFVIESVV